MRRLIAALVALAAGVFAVEAGRRVVVVVPPSGGGGVLSEDFSTDPCASRWDCNGTWTYHEATDDISPSGSGTADIAVYQTSVGTADNCVCVHVSQDHNALGGLGVLTRSTVDNSGYSLLIGNWAQTGGSQNYWFVWLLNNGAWVIDWLKSPTGVTDDVADGSQICAKTTGTGYGEDSTVTLYYFITYDSANDCDTGTPDRTITNWDTADRALSGAEQSDLNDNYYVGMGDQDNSGAAYLDNWKAHTE